MTKQRKLDRLQEKPTSSVEEDTTRLNQLWAFRKEYRRMVSVIERAGRLPLGRTWKGQSEVSVSVYSGARGVTAYTFHLYGHDPERWELPYETLVHDSLSEEGFQVQKVVIDKRWTDSMPEERLSYSSATKDLKVYVLYDATPAYTEEWVRSRVGWYNANRDERVGRDLKRNYSKLQAGKKFLPGEEVLGSTGLPSTIGFLMEPNHRFWYVCAGRDNSSMGFQVVLRDDMAVISKNLSLPHQPEHFPDRKWREFFDARRRHNPYCPLLKEWDEECKEGKVE